MERHRGIRSLIPTGTLEAPEETVREVPIDQLLASPYQPRRRVNEESLAELAESIKAHGILQPLILRRTPKGYEVIAGERRLRAAEKAGLTRVPAIVREAKDQEMLELALVENLQREDINPMEAAEAYGRLIQEFGLNQEQVAERVGKSRSAVANTLRMLTLPDPVKEGLRDGLLEEGHGKLLASIQDHRLVLEIWRRIKRRRLSVRATAELIVKLLGNVPRGTILGKPNKSNWLPPNLEWLQGQMREKLGCRVVLKPDHVHNKGMVEIHYGDEEGLERVIEVITGELITFGAREARQAHEEEARKRAEELREG